MSGRGWNLVRALRRAGELLALLQGLDLLVRADLDDLLAVEVEPVTGQDAALAVGAELRERQAGLLGRGNVRVGNDSARNVDLRVRGHHELLQAVAGRELVLRRAHERDRGLVAVHLVQVRGDVLAQVRADDDGAVGFHVLHVGVGLQASLRESR